MRYASSMAPLLILMYETDKETAGWPIPDDAESDFIALKETHWAQPLAVYHNEKFIEPHDVHASLVNAIVEVHFSFKHYHITQDKDTFDSFTGNVEQVL